MHSLNGQNYRAVCMNMVVTGHGDAFGSALPPRARAHRVLIVSIATIIILF